MREDSTGSLTPTTAEMEVVKGGIQAIRDRRRGRIPWHITKHTAEMAIAALNARSYRRSAKNRRRKKSKRLL